MCSWAFGQSTAPKKVLGLWQGMTVAEFKEAVNGDNPHRQQSECVDCLFIQGNKMPVAYRNFPTVAGMFYRQRLVGIVLQERANASGDGSEVTGEADKIAADLGAAYGKPEKRRECTEPGFTYETIGQNWTTALQHAAINWYDTWNFGSAVFGSNPSNEEASKANLSRIELTLISGFPGTAYIYLTFEFQDYDQYDAAVKKTKP